MKKWKPIHSPLGLNFTIAILAQAYLTAPRCRPGTKPNEHTVSCLLSSDLHVPSRGTGETFRVVPWPEGQTNHPLGASTVFCARGAAAARPVGLGHHLERYPPPPKNPSHLRWLIQDDSSTTRIWIDLHSLVLATKYPFEELTKMWELHFGQKKVFLQHSYNMQLTMHLGPFRRAGLQVLNHGQW